MSESKTLGRWSTWPLCDPCWVEVNGDREPIRLREAERAGCVLCGRHAEITICVRALATESGVRFR